MPAERTPPKTRLRARRSIPSSNQSPPRGRSLARTPPPLYLPPLGDIRADAVREKTVTAETPAVHDLPIAQRLHPEETAAEGTEVLDPPPTQQGDHLQEVPIEEVVIQGEQPILPQAVEMANPPQIPPGWQNWEAFARTLLANRPVLPEYHGRDHEDPEAFLARCTEYFLASQTPNEQRTQTAEVGLKGAAEKWWESYRFIGVDWERFQDLVRNKFNSIQARNTLMAHLYSKKQGEKEPVGVFLQQKYLIYQRLRPDDPEATKITTLIGLLKPSTRKILRSRDPVDFADLLTKALEAEKEEEEDCAAQRNNRPKKESTTEDKAKVEPAKNSAPKCWHCPAYHLHKDCPVLKEQRQKTENWREAGETPAAAATQK